MVGTIEEAIEKARKMATELGLKNPPTRKDDYILDPEAFRLQAANLPEDFAPTERVLWDIAYTTGTTSGKPSPFYNTTHDAYAIWDQARRCNEAECERDDRDDNNKRAMTEHPGEARLVSAPASGSMCSSCRSRTSRSRSR